MSVPNLQVVQLLRTAVPHVLHKESLKTTEIFTNFYENLYEIIINPIVLKNLKTPAISKSSDQKCINKQDLIKTKH